MYTRTYYVDVDMYSYRLCGCKQQQQKTHHQQKSKKQKTNTKQQQQQQQQQQKKKQPTKQKPQPPKPQIQLQTNKNKQAKTTTTTTTTTTVTATHMTLKRVIVLSDLKPKLSVMSLSRFAANHDTKREHRNITAIISGVFLPLQQWQPCIALHADYMNTAVTVRTGCACDLSVFLKLCKFSIA